VCLNLICESQAAIPVFRQAASGNASDKTDFRRMIAQHVLPLRNHLGVEYIVADSSLYTEKTLEMLGAHMPFITRVPETRKEAKDAIFKVNPDEMISIDDVYSYQVVLSNDAGVRQRWLIMRREQASRREHRTLIKKISRDTENEDKPFQKLKSWEFACAEDALKACRKLQATFTYSRMLDLTADAVKKYANRGKPSAKTTVKHTVYRLEGTLVCSISNIREVEKKLGVFILATNDLDDRRLSAQEVLALYKGQSKSERGFKFLKSPYFLAASFFVKKPERIEALLMIMTLCLLG
jgi:transposase